MTSLNEVPLGFILALSGRAAQGLAVLRRGMQAPDAIGLTWLRGRRPTYLGEACLLAGQVDEGNAVGEQALAFCREHKERGHEAWALRLLGEIASDRRPPDTRVAEDHYRQALALATNLSMRPLVAHCHPGLGRLYRRTGEQLKAHQHLTTAATMYRELGMGFWLEKAEGAKSSSVAQSGTP